MIRSTRTGLLVATAVPLVALALTACGSGNGTTGPTAPGTTSSGPSATVNVATEGNLGKVLVDAQGRTLYLFQKDAGTKSACTGACAAAWPPLRATSKPVVGTALSASKVGTAARPDGKPQVTYNGHPLYLYAGDEDAGDIEGQGVTAFGGGWSALTPDGNHVSGQPPSSGGGGGY